MTLTAEADRLENDIRDLSRAGPGELARRLIDRGWSTEPAGLDVERLNEAIFRVGTGYRGRAIATIAGRLANSQDGARASGEFAEAVAAEYARLARSESPAPDGLHWHDVPGVGTLWWDAAGKIVGGPEDG